MNRKARSVLNPVFLSCLYCNHCTDLSLSLSLFVRRGDRFSSDIRKMVTNSNIAHGQFLARIKRNLILIVSVSLFLVVHGPFVPIISWILLDRKLQSNQRYDINDRVPLHINTIGPYNNPHETYDVGRILDYFPFFCKLTTKSSSRQNNNTTTTRTAIAEESEQDLRPSDPFWLPFKIFGPMTDLGYQIQLPSTAAAGHAERHYQQQQQECTTQKPLSTYQYQNLDFAIRNHWFYRMKLGRDHDPDISFPVTGMLGEILPASSQTATATTTETTTTQPLASSIEVSALQGHDNNNNNNEQIINSHHVIHDKTDPLAPFIYTRRHLTVWYCFLDDEKDSGGQQQRQQYQIYQVGLTHGSNSLQKIQAGEPITFYLDVTWINEMPTANGDNDNGSLCSQLSSRSGWDTHQDHDEVSKRWKIVVGCIFMVTALLFLLQRFYNNYQGRENHRHYMYYDKKRSSDLPAMLNNDNNNTSLRKPLLSGNDVDCTSNDMNEQDNDSNQIRPMVNDMLLDEPPFLPFLASLVGTGSQILIMTWLVVCYVSFRLDGSGKVWDGDNSRFFLSSLWLTWIFSGSLVAGYSSTLVVLLYARPTKIKEDVLDVFEGELMLEMNAMSDDDDDDFDDYNKIASSPINSNDKPSTKMIFHEKSAKDEEIYLSRMIQWSIGYTISIVPLLHGAGIAVLGTLAGARGAYFGIHPRGLLTSVVCWLLLGTSMCILGSNIAQRQMTIRSSTASVSSSLADQFFKTSSNDRRNVILSVVSSVPVRLLVLVSGLVTSITLCQEISMFILESYVGYKSYIPSLSILCVYVLYVTTAIVVSQLTMKHIVHDRKCQTGQNHWQWLAFGCGGSTCTFVVLVGLYRLWQGQPGINGWYEWIHSILVLLIVSVDVGLATGAITYISGHVTVRSILPHKSIS